MKEDIESLKFVSNVIELKPDKKYLLVFKDTDGEVLDITSNALHRSGFDCFCIAVSKDENLQIIEAPAKTEQEYPWSQLGQILTINERRALFEAWETLETVQCMDSDEKTSQEQ